MTQGILPKFKEKRVDDGPFAILTGSISIQEIIEIPVGSELSIGSMSFCADEVYCLTKEKVTIVRVTGTRLDGCPATAPLYKREVVQGCGGGMAYVLVDDQLQAHLVAGDRVAETKEDRNQFQYRYYIFLLNRELAKTLDNTNAFQLDGYWYAVRNAMDMDRCDRWPKVVAERGTQV